MLLLTCIPAFQRWSAGTASRMLEDKIESRVSIGNLRLNLPGHIILDNVKLYDRRDTLMLQASRIAAKVDLMPLVRTQIRISGSQLIGTKAKIYKDGDEPFNFQFLVDAFSKKDTTSSPLDLSIGALVIRRGEVQFDMWPPSDSPEGKRTTPLAFNPRHLHLSNISLTAKMHFIKPDSLSLDIRHLAFTEQSGLQVKRLTASLPTSHLKGRGEKHLTFQVELPKTTLKGEIQTSSDFKTLSPLTGELEGVLCPRDLSCFVPRLANFADIINLSSNIRLEDGTLRLPNLSVSDNGGNISLLCSTTASDLKNSPDLFVNIKELHTGPALQHFLTENLQGQAREISPILTQLGSTKSSGTIGYQSHNLRTSLLTESGQGTVSIDATLRNMQEVKADIAATNIRLGHLLGLSDKAKSTTASFDATVEGTLPNKDRQAKLSLMGLLNSLTYKGYEHRGIPFSANIDGDAIAGKVKVDEPNGLAIVNGQCSMVNGKRALQCQMQVKDFAPHNMLLTEGYEGERFSGNLDADFSNINPNRLEGELRLTGLKLASEEKGTVEAGDLVLTGNTSDNTTHLRVKSDFLEVMADGNMNWASLPASFLLPVRQNLASLFQLGDKHPQPSGNDFRFFVQVQDTILAGRLLDSELRLPEKSIIEGTVSDAVGQIALLLNVPQLQMGDQQFQNISCRTEASKASLQTSLQCERIMKGLPVEISLDAYATDNKVTSRLQWDNKRDVAYTGDVRMTGTVRRDLTGNTVIDARMNDSRIVIGDTLWQIKPATIKYHDKVIDVENLSISQGGKHINIGGRISGLESDTLKAELADISIAYIMDLVNFHKVDFDGRTTGSIYATSLMKKPYADAFLQVKDFTFNAANLGNMDLYANWGKQERAITLEADTKGPLPKHRTLITGTIIPGKGMDDGLNLNVQTSYMDLSFLSKFTKNIFSGLEGRTSGRARIFGPFKFVNLEGDMIVNEMKMHVLALGTDYHLAGDSVIMRPDNIWLHGARIYDDMGMPGTDEHTAAVEVHLMHHAFKRLSFDFSIDAHNLLGYNFPHQGGTSFFGTAYADAQVHLSGEPGSVNIDIKATPMPGTVLQYNTATTGTVDESGFVTYTSQKTLSNSPLKEEDTGQEVSPLRGDLEGSSDLHINFDIDANPNAQIRILMDPRSGDNISLYGNGRLRANYYNKGRFQLFGTYRVSEGNYRMSIRDLIRKDFTFQPDGTIVFGGDAMQAALNLTAKHTVPNVSLDDLSTTRLGLSNTRVDCIMNIGGIAREPIINFDFDIPNANEDEKQMVRSMLSTEEERDMQVIYLLGVGRFYSYGSFIDKKQTQGGMAMNSVLSSALSSRFNQIMSQALGGTGWTFGTNLRTGEDGWQELDAEALVSGKMLSGRLQFNGNFGYRENKYKMGNNNFIGDFDIQYRLSPRSPFSLKAYNQTNDRYFTQSSLTTQGVGIKFQRDFTRWQELFHRAKKKSKKK